MYKKQRSGICKQAGIGKVDVSCLPFLPRFAVSFQDNFVVSSLVVLQKDQRKLQKMDADPSPVHFLDSPRKRPRYASCK